MVDIKLVEYGISPGTGGGQILFRNKTERYLHFAFVVERKWTRYFRCRGSRCNRSLEKTRDVVSYESIFFRFKVSKKGKNILTNKI